MVWKRFFFLEGPPPRIHGSFVIIGKRKYLVGGSSMPENLLYNDLWSMNLGKIYFNL